MKLIEVEKVKRVMKDYWKAQVDKALIFTADRNEANKRINSYLEHNHELLKAIDELPSVQPERPKGEWIHQVKFSRVECDQCGKVFRNTFAPKNFCPNCGADMKGECDE